MIRVARAAAFAAAMGVSGCAYTWGIENAPLMGGPGPHSRWMRVSASGAAYDVDLHIPRNRAPGDSLPFVIVLHGAGGTGPGMERRTRFSELADSIGFVVAYPTSLTNAEGRRLWATPASFASDTGMLRALIDSVAASVPLQRRRVYLSGFSNGGGMTYRAAQSMHDVFAAIGVVAGASRGGGTSSSAALPVPLIAIHGMLDETVPFTGAPVAVRSWARHNGCDDRVTTDTLAGGNAIRTLYTSCPPEGRVVFYAMVHGGHAWPNAGTREALFAATVVVWNFFRDHAS